LLSASSLLSRTSLRQAWVAWEDTAKRATKAAVRLMRPAIAASTSSWSGAACWTRLHLAARGGVQVS
jgi:hypothetical protein